MHFLYGENFSFPLQAVNEKAGSIEIENPFDDNCKVILEDQPDLKTSDFEKLSQTEQIQETFEEIKHQHVDNTTNKVDILKLGDQNVNITSEFTLINESNLEVVAKDTEIPKYLETVADNQIFNPPLLASNELEESMHLTMFDKSHIEYEQQVSVDALKSEYAITIEKMAAVYNEKLSQLEAELTKYKSDLKNAESKIESLVLERKEDKPVTPVCKIISSI